MSTKRTLIFSLDPTSELYWVSPDPSVPESLKIDTSFFPSASIEHELDGKWIMTMRTSRFETIDTQKKIVKGSKFLIFGNELYSPSAQSLTGFVHAFRIDTDDDNLVLCISVVVCEPGFATPIITPEEMRRINDAVEKVAKLGMWGDPFVFKEEGDFFQ
jgi:hypothetical protein